MAIRKARRLNRWIRYAACALASLPALPALAVSVALQSSSTIGQSQPQDQDIKNFQSLIPSDLTVLHRLDTGVSSTLASSDGWISGMAGALHAVSNASVTTGSQAFSNAFNQGAIVDVLHVTSPSLANGTPVALHLALSFSVLYSASLPASGLSFGITSFLTANDGLQSASLFSDGPKVVIDAGLTQGQGDDVLNATLQTFVGASVTLDQRISIAAHAEPELFTGIGRSAKADASHSAHFYVDAATAGVVLVADSGHNYASALAVPEPSESALLISGLALVGLVTRRRRLPVV